ncbi:uncharacterized protein LOC109543843 [Dendroctonus ponderosae]
MIINLASVLSLVELVYGQNYDFLENLGSRISSQVQAGLAPLQGLGDRINAQVQQSLAGPKANIKSRLGSLDGLGTQIEQSVYHGLEPVRAIELNFKMRDGVGGITIVTHQPGGRQFVIKNHKIFTCSSQIDIESGFCSGLLIPYQPRLATSSHMDKENSSPRSDWCYVLSSAQSNNNICLSTSSLSVQIINFEIKCGNTDNSPILITTLDEYRKLCSAVRQSTEFRYIPNKSDRSHVQIPNNNKYVKCENRQENVCIFHEDNNLLNHNNGNVYINYNN